MKTIQRFFGVFALLSISSTASAEETDLTSNEQQLYGNHTGRVTLGGFFGSGTAISLAGGSATAPGKQLDFTNSGGDLGFDWGFFGNQTMFKTHLGGEVSTSLGFRGGQKLDSGVQTDGGIAFRLDAAFSYGVLHGDIGVPARLTFLVGPGFTYDPDYVGTDTYAYLLLGMRGGVRIGDTTDAHLQYVYVPGTGSSDYLIREHRLEGAINFGPLAAGVRYQRQSVTTSDEKLNAVSPRLGAFIGYAF